MATKCSYSILSSVSCRRSRTSGRYDTLCLSRSCQRVQYPPHCICISLRYHARNRCYAQHIPDNCRESQVNVCISEVSPGTLPRAFGERNEIATQPLSIWTIRSRPSTINLSPSVRSEISKNGPIFGIIDGCLQSCTISKGYTAYKLYNALSQHTQWLNTDFNALQISSWCAPFTRPSMVAAASLRPSLRSSSTIRYYMHKSARACIRKSPQIDLTLNPKFSNSATIRPIQTITGPATASKSFPLRRWISDVRHIYTPYPHKPANIATRV